MNIKPCPFCGSEGIIIKTSTMYWDSYNVVCCGEKDGNCSGLHVNTGYDEESEAVEQWNKRYEEEK